LKKNISPYFLDEAEEKILPLPLFISFE